MSLKYSRQRETIKNFLKTRSDHPTADTVYLNVRNTLPKISLGTVYRNLTLLADMGEIQRIYADGVNHYDYNIEVHYHFYCLECREVSDINLEAEAGLIERAKECFSGTITSYTTCFYGKCKDCSLN